MVQLPRSYQLVSIYALCIFMDFIFIASKIPKKRLHIKTWLDHLEKLASINNRAQFQVLWWRIHEIGPRWVIMMIPRAMDMRQRAEFYIHDQMETKDPRLIQSKKPSKLLDHMFHHLKPEADSKNKALWANKIWKDSTKKFQIWAQDPKWAGLNYLSH